MIKYLEDKRLIVSHTEFSDHYNYRDIDLLKFKDEIIITTEKDYVKLKNFNLTSPKTASKIIEPLILESP